MSLWSAREQILQGAEHASNPQPSRRIMGNASGRPKARAKFSVAAEGHRFN